MCNFECTVCVVCMGTQINISIFLVNMEQNMTVLTMIQHQTKIGNAIIFHLELDKKQQYIILCV